MCTLKILSLVLFLICGTILYLFIRSKKDPWWFRVVLYVLVMVLYVPAGVVVGLLTLSTYIYYGIKRNKR